MAIDVRDIMLPMMGSSVGKVSSLLDTDRNETMSPSTTRQRRLLAVTYHFPPSAASGTHRLLGFARNLPRNGWDMSVVAPPSLPWEPVDQALVSQIPECTRLFHVEYTRGYSTWPLRKFFPYAAWLFMARRSLQSAAMTCRPDSVLTSGPPHCVHMAGLYLKRRFGIPWVADFRDPWLTGQFLKKPWNERTVVQRIGESLAFALADKIIVNAPNALSEVVAQCPQVASKIHFVTNGFDPALFAGIERRPHARFVIGHAGQLYAGRDPRPFLDAVQLLVGRDAQLRQRLSIEFIGSTTDTGLQMAGGQMAAEIERRGLTGTVNLVGRVPYRESLQRMVDADVLLLIDSSNRRIGVPAKLYEYFGANRPVLALAREDSDVHWALRKSGVTFRLAALHDVESIAAGLDFFLQNRAEQMPTAESSHFSRATIASQLADILRELPNSPFPSL